MMGNRRRSMAYLLPKKDTLENTSWANIDKVAAAGKAAEYWDVGDTKTITFPSAVLGSTVITVKIMGFDYDDLADGSGKTPITFGMVDCFATKARMNSWDSNMTSWGECELRTTIINTVLPAFRAVISGNIIKPVSKRTSAGLKSTTINTTTDSIWLFSEYEIFGVVTLSVSGEKPTDKSICYPAFTDSASRIKKAAGAALYGWWGRSPHSNSNTVFCKVGSDGGANNANASSDSGVAVGFCV